jgi:hypothetical protein
MKPAKRPATQNEKEEEEVGKDFGIVAHKAKLSAVKKNGEKFRTSTSPRNQTLSLALKPRKDPQSSVPRAPTRGGLPSPSPTHATAMQTAKSVRSRGAILPVMFVAAAILASASTPLLTSVTCVRNQFGVQINRQPGSWKVECAQVLQLAVPPQSMIGRPTSSSSSDTSTTELLVPGQPIHVFAHTLAKRFTEGPISSAARTRRLF